MTKITKQKKLKEYINLRKNKTKIININEALFLNKNGQRLQQHGVEYICKKAFKLAGLEEYNYTTHSLRHTVAAQLYMNNVDLLVIKEILGHSDTAVTMKYYIDIDTDFIESENQNVVDYLINKNIFEYAK